MRDLAPRTPANTYRPCLAAPSRPRSRSRCGGSAESGKQSPGQACLSHSPCRETSPQPPPEMPGPLCWLRGLLSPRAPSRACEGKEPTAAGAAQSWHVHLRKERAGRCAFTPTLQMRGWGVGGEVGPGPRGYVGVGPDAPPAVSSRESWAACSVGAGSAPAQPRIKG